MNSKTAREKLIGWYHTGPKLRASDLEINEVIKRYTSRPVMVIVDVRPDNERLGGDIPTDAYFAVEEIKDVGPPSPLYFQEPQLMLCARFDRMEPLAKKPSSTSQPQ